MVWAFARYVPVHTFFGLAWWRLSGEVSWERWACDVVCFDGCFFRRSEGFLCRPVRCTCGARIEVPSYDMNRVYDSLLLLLCGSWYLRFIRSSYQLLPVTTKPTSRTGSELG